MGAALGCYRILDEARGLASIYAVGQEQERARVGAFGKKTMNTIGDI